MRLMPTRMWLFPVLLIIALFAPGCAGGRGEGTGLDGGGNAVVALPVGPPTPTGTPAATATVSSINPINGATGVAVARQIVATFAQAMNPATVNGSSFLLLNGATTVPATVVYDASTGAATLTPKSALPFSTLLTVRLGATATDLAGNTLIPFMSTFTTAASASASPTVTSVTPAAGAGAIGTNVAVRVTFSTAMNPSTLVNANFFLTDATGALVPGLVTRDANNLGATFTPNANLAATSTHTVRVIAGAEDQAGNPLTPFSSTFTTGVGPDPTVPFVRSVDPLTGAVGVVLNKKIVVTFGQAMNPTTLDTPAASFTLMNGALSVAGTVAYDVTTATATFTPTVNLAPNTPFTVSVGAAATDLAGHPLVPFLSTFTTGTALAAPTVSSVNPSQGATGIAINRTVTVTFAQGMNGATVSSPATTFTLSSGGTPIAGTVVYNAPSSTAVFTPTANLPINALIQVNVSAGAQDLAGNALTPFTSSFTTGSQVGQMPVVLGATLNSFAVLAGSTVTNANATTVTGDLGVSPGSAVTGFPPGILIGTLHAGDGTAAQAQIDLTAAFTDVSTRGGAPITVAGNLGGQTLPPGLYKSTSSLSISSGDLTLDAQGDSEAVFVFQMASTFTSTTGRQIILKGGAKSSNIFWSVGSSATLGSFSSFKGTILSQTSISVVSGATVDGRVVTRVGAVTLDAATIMRPTP